MHHAEGDSGTVLSETTARSDDNAEDAPEVQEDCPKEECARTLMGSARLVEGDFFPVNSGPGVDPEDPCDATLETNIDNALHARAGTAAVTRTSRVRKSVKWATGSSFSSHAKTFALPGFAHVDPEQHAPLSFASGKQAVTAAPVAIAPIFREVRNDDGTCYMVSRSQNPAPKYLRWHDTALAAQSMSSDPPYPASLRSTEIFPEDGLPVTPFSALYPPRQPLRQAPDSALRAIIKKGVVPQCTLHVYSSQT